MLSTMPNPIIGKRIGFNNQRGEKLNGEFGLLPVQAGPKNLRLMLFVWNCRTQVGNRTTPPYRPQQRSKTPFFDRVYRPQEFHPMSADTSEHHSPCQTMTAQVYQTRANPTRLKPAQWREQRHYTSLEELDPQPEVNP